MNMLSFYGGPAGKDFTIAKIFDSKASLDADIMAGNASKVRVGDYVLVSYGDPDSPTFFDNKQKDGNKSYNATLWKKDWNNGYEYRLICRLLSIICCGHSRCYPPVRCIATINHRFFFSC